ncbi:cytochrome p450 61 [Apiospora aurea]|uniref:sterol 22-desaturase n=1 Tax=Apiospora aurea TaxID=335848 RepID=A0ABR1QK70_9PEZI
MASNASSFSSPLAEKFAAVNLNLPPHVDFVVDTISNAGILTWIATLLALAIAYDQISYQLSKGNIVGPAFKEPFIGPFLQSVNPKFEEYYAKWKSGPLSCVSVFHKFVVIASTRDLARKVFNAPAYAKPCVVDVAHKILGAKSWVFLDGKEHVDYRKGLNGLFTRKALECYLPRQEDVLRHYFARWTDITKENKGQPIPFMQEFREIITALSCRTFVGYYISEDAIKRITVDYFLVTEALELVNFPIIIPFTKTWRGKKAADMVMNEFAKCAAKAKVRMNAGGEVTCIMDAWIKDMINSRKWREATEKGLSTEGLEKPMPMIREFTDMEISQTLFTFLFASQDATSSASTYLFQIMAQRPDVLDRVREENHKVRNGDIHAAVNMDQLESMAYTRAVVKELLRYRPPVLMVPYEVKKPFPITDSYTVPKGAMLIPTTYMALRDPDVYERPDEFDPERYYTGDAEVKGSKNFLVFGTGAHYCLGQHYAQLNLALMIGKASLLLDWKHHATPLSEEIKVFATIFPKDDCPLTFTDRKW